jgi:arylsulfatase A-like enzyme
MPRMNVVPAVGGVAVLALALFTSALVPASSGATPVDRSTRAPVVGIDPTSDLADLTPDERRSALGRTPFERQALAADRTSVGLQGVVGDRDRPNVLVLMMDDMRDDDLQFMPNVQRLIADQGVRFTNTFSPHPLCCPARTSFLTGLYSHNHEVWSHKAPFGFPSFDDRQTFPRWLHENGGYDTAFVGKYLNGYGRLNRRDGSSSLRYVPPGWTDWRPSVDNVHDEPEARHLQGGTYRYFDTTLSDNGKLEPHPGVYQSTLYSDITQEVIRRQARSPRPFFMQASFAAPHGGTPKEKDDPRAYARSDGFRQTWQNPARPKHVKGRFDHRITRLPPWLHDEDVADKPDLIRSEPPLVAEEYEAVLEDYRQRAEAVSAVDDEVANIIATLDRTGELDNTYVMFTSDNGYFLGEHRRRQGKILPYDPSLRVPLVMRGPGIPAAQARRDPFLMVDFAPTILDAAGVRTDRPLDGRSMLDVARNGDRGWTRPIFTETGPIQLSVEIFTAGDLLQRRHGPSALRFSQGVRTGRYLYVEHASRDKELYDLRQDPQQLDNRIDLPRYRTVRRTLARELDRLRECDGPGCSDPLPPRLWSERPVPAATWDPGRPPPSTIWGP